MKLTAEQLQMLDKGEGEGDDGDGDDERVKSELERAKTRMSLRQPQPMRGLSHSCQTQSDSLVCARALKAQEHVQVESQGNAAADFCCCLVVVGGFFCGSIQCLLGCG